MNDKDRWPRAGRGGLVNDPMQLRAIRGRSVNLRLRYRVARRRRLLLRDAESCLGRGSPRAYTSASAECQKKHYKEIEATLHVSIRARE